MPMNLLHSGWIRGGAAIALVGAMIWFASQALVDGAESVEQGALLSDLEWFALATGLFMLATLALGIAWIVILESVVPNEPHRRGRLMLAFSYSWLGRYVPGTVPFFAGKVYLGARLGYGTRPLVVATAVQNVLEILIATVVGATMIVAAQGMTAGGGRYLLLAVLPSVALAGLHPVVLRRIVDASLRVLRREPLPAGALPPTRALMAASFFAALNQALNGIALWVILRAVGGASIDDVFLATGALSLAGVAGILVVLVPAGLGVRDGALTALLASRFTVEVAALAAVMLRLLTVVADLLLFAIAFLIDTVADTRVGWHAIRGKPALEAVPTSTANVSTTGAVSERRSA